MTNTDVYVKTRQQEFNYPEGDTTTSPRTRARAASSWAASCAASAGLRPRRLAKLPFSDDVNAQSRLLMRRNVRDRVAALAPFLTFDQDPYIVVGDDGRLSWIMDAFTSSDTYPYSQPHTASTIESINYMRNSVKAVIDAYDGTTTFYVFDSEIPSRAYRGIFPEPLQGCLNDAGLAAQACALSRVLLSLQAEVYGLYHMTNPEVFYNREDLWTVATETGMAMAEIRPRRPCNRTSCS
jgi:uncharacterized protein